MDGQEVRTARVVGQRSHQQRDRSPVENRGRQVDCGQADDTY